MVSIDQNLSVFVVVVKKLQVRVCLAIGRQFGNERSRFFEYIKSTLAGMSVDEAIDEIVGTCMVWMNLKWIHVLILKCCVSTEEQPIRVEYKDYRWHGEGFFVGFRVRGTAYFCIPSCEKPITTSSTNFTYQMPRSPFLSRNPTQHPQVQVRLV